LGVAIIAGGRGVTDCGTGSAAIDMSTTLKCSRFGGDVRVRDYLLSVGALCLLVSMAALPLLFRDGESVVSLEYRDNYFCAGLAISLLAAVGLCGYGAFARGRRATATG
jgi:hypothetical protein